MNTPFIDEHSGAVTFPTIAPAVPGKHGSVKLVPAGAFEWTRLLSLVAHDIYHTEAYHRVSTQLTGGEAWLAVYTSGDGCVLWPYVVQNIRDVEGMNDTKRQDITSVYGYAGPLTSHRPAGDLWKYAWSALSDLWRSQGIVSVFTRFHPILSNQQWLECLECKVSRQSDHVTCNGVSPHGTTLVIDLTGPKHEIWQRYTHNLRCTLRQSRRLGMVTTADPEWKHMDDFIRLYYATMRRNNALPFYFFPKKYFLSLRSALGAHTTLLITRLGDEIIGGVILFEYGGIVNFHLGASDDRFIRLSPLKFTLHEAQNWSRRRGNRLFNLGGGRGNRDDDSLFGFKKQFSRATYKFYTGRWVLDDATYICLTQGRRSRAESTQNGIVEDFFPQYRAPLTVSSR
jgi:hypothetical protein